MKHPIMQHVESEMDIVPYTRSDRIVQVIILFFVVVNCAAVVIQVIWGI